MGRDFKNKRTANAYVTFHRRNVLPKIQRDSICNVLRKTSFYGEKSLFGIYMPFAFRFLIGSRPKVFCEIFAICQGTLFEFMISQ